MVTKNYPAQSTSAKKDEEWSGFQSQLEEDFRTKIQTLPQELAKMIRPENYLIAPRKRAIRVSLLP